MTRATITTSCRRIRHTCPKRSTKRRRRATKPKTYETAHRLLSEVRALERPHPYEDEIWLLDAYVDSGVVSSSSVAEKLDRFLKRYEPVRDAAASSHQSPRALARAARRHEAAARAASGSPDEVGCFLARPCACDLDVRHHSRELAEVEHQLGGLTRVRAEMSGDRAEPERRGAVQPARRSPIVDTAGEQRVRLQNSSAPRAARREAPHGQADLTALASLKKQLAILEERSRNRGAAKASYSRSSPSAASWRAPGSGPSPSRAPRKGGRARCATSCKPSRASWRAKRWRGWTQRLTRLIRRARAGRIETVLGKKRAVELEVEALSQGYLPQGAVDSLDAARYLRDDEEYWPFDGEDWEDEYVGGEGLR